VSTQHRHRVEEVFDRVAPDYDRHIPFFAALAESFVDWLDVVSGSRALDLGVGRGAVASRLEAKGAWVAKVDLSSEMLRFNAGPRARMDAEQLGFASGCFDLVTSAFTVHLLEHPRAGMAEAVRCLRPTGRLAIALPRPVTGPWEEYFAILGSYQDRLPPNPFHPTVTPVGDLADALAAAGLVQISTHDVVVRVSIPDPETFLAGERSHGCRSFFDQLPPDAQSDLERDVLQWLRSKQREDELLLDRFAVFGVGTRP
jgi:SAM-dependent methyltransferase